MREELISIALTKLAGGQQVIKPKPHRNASGVYDPPPSRAHYSKLSQRRADINAGTIKDGTRPNSLAPYKSVLNEKYQTIRAGIKKKAGITSFITKHPYATAIGAGSVVGIGGGLALGHKFRKDVEAQTGEPIPYGDKAALNTYFTKHFDEYGNHRKQPKKAGITDDEYKTITKKDPFWMKAVTVLGGSALRRKDLEGELHHVGRKRFNDKYVTSGYDNNFSFDSRTHYIRKHPGVFPAKQLAYLQKKNGLDKKANMPIKQRLREAKARIDTPARELAAGSVLGAASVAMARSKMHRGALGAGIASGGLLYRAISKDHRQVKRQIEGQRAALGYY